MIQIAEMIQKAKAEGYNEANAEAKVCQDIVLTLISQSSMNRNITVKGGVVMRSISHDEFLQAFDEHTQRLRDTIEQLIANGSV